MFNRPNVTGYGPKVLDPCCASSAPKKGSSGGASGRVASGVGVVEDLGVVVTDDVGVGDTGVAFTHPPRDAAVATARSAAATAVRVFS